jgi:hypothetical protein
MKRIFAVVLAATCVVGSTPSFALGGVVHLLGHTGDGGFVRNPTTLALSSRGPLVSKSAPGQTIFSRSPLPMPVICGRVIVCT